MFQFEVVVTEKCNLYCEYYYMANKNKHMTKEVFDAHYAALPRIMDVYGEKRFTTILTGGEPLLNWGLIEHILPIVDADPKCQGVTLSTNGLLITQDMIHILRKYNVNVLLSFDGLWQEDELGDRAMRKGGSTIRYMNIVRDLGVDTCKVMIPPQSHREFTLKSNYKWFVEEFGMANPDFTLVRDDIWEPLEIAVFKFEIKELADQVIKYIKQGIETMPGIFSLNILDTIAGQKYGKRSFGCFAGVHGLGFMPNGKVYPCARFGSVDMDSEIFDSFSEDVYVEWNCANYSKFVNKNLTDPRTFEECKDCVLYEYCNAGCIYSQLNKNGGPLKSICELYLASYEQAFRIVEELKDNKTFKKVMNNFNKEITMKPDDIPPKEITMKKVPSIEMPGIEAMSRKIECECETGTSDQEKLIRYRCAQSLFHISMDLKQTELMASNVCLVIAKGLIVDLELPAGIHTPQTIHDSNGPAEVEAMAEKIREELNSPDAPHSFLSKLDDEMVSDHG